MKRFFAILLSTIVAIVSLTGCIQENASVTINADGSATVNAIIKIEKEYYESQYSSNEFNIAEEIKQESPNATINEYEETIKGETYKCFDISESFSSIAKAKKSVFDGTLFESGTMSKTKFVANYGTYSNDFTKDSLSISKSDMEAMQNLIKITFSVTFPQKIVYTNGKLSKDKKTATWNLVKLPNAASICAYTNKKEIKAGPVKELKATKMEEEANIQWAKTYKASGYQIKLGTNKKLTSGKKTVNVKKNASKAKIKGLKSDKNYYVKIRSYIKIGSKKYYGKWSKVTAVYKTVIKN